MNESFPYIVAAFMMVLPEAILIILPLTLYFIVKRKTKRKKVKPVIFLDIDGVLMTGNYLSESFKKHNKRIPGIPETLCPIAMENFKKLIEVVDPDIVISSTWRMKDDSMYMLMTEFKRFGISEDIIIGTTPIKSPLGNYRGHQIYEWLNNNPQVKHIAIIDDDDDMWNLSPFLIQCDWNTGLTESKVMEVILTCRELYKGLKR